MVEKRGYAGDHESPSGAKRTKPSSAMDAVAQAMAKAAEIKARLSSGTAANGTATPTPSAAPSAAGGAAERLAAMKARLAALKSGGAATSDAPVPSPPPPSESRVRPSEDRGPRFATTLGNRSAALPVAAPKPSKPVIKPDEEKDNPYFDPKAIRVGRTSRALNFNLHGKYLEVGSKLRAEKKLEDIRKKLALQARRAGLDQNTERGFLVPAPGDVEWWDEGLLGDKTYDCIDDPSKLKIDGDDSLITIYVQHPVLLPPTQSALLQTVKPMYLTTKEQAKLRRMRRAAELKEHQAKIRLGLEPPPPPKVKRGNMMRVMGEQAIADPTAVEQLVESQIKERHDKHLEANEERKLTKEERVEKLTQNQQKDAAKSLHMCVFKIDSLAYGKHRYQIDINAREFALTGVVIMNPRFSLVIAEGGSFSIEKYKKLLLSRMKWTDNGFPTERQMELQKPNEPTWIKPTDEQGVLKDHSSNRCVCVFEGEIKDRLYKKWGSKMCETVGEAKELLARTKLESLWAMAEHTT